MAEQFTGFLPEPIPAIPIAASEVARHLEHIRGMVLAPNTRRDLYYDLIATDQRRKLDDKRLEELIGEQAMELMNKFASVKVQVLELYEDDLRNNRPDVSNEQLKELLVELTTAALRELSPPPIDLDEALGDIRRFVDLLVELVAVIASRLVANLRSGWRDDPEVYFCGSIHPDIQDDEGVTFVLDWGDQWNEAMGDSVRNVRVVDVPWPGRHAIKEDWYAFARVLAGRLKQKCTFDH